MQDIDKWRRTFEDHIILRGYLAKNESDLTTFVPGEYIYMMPSELYKGLVDAEISNGKISAPVLCCTCGEVGCSSARVKIFNTGSSII